MAAKYGFGVIGCGSIAEIAHFPSIERTKGAELIACCDLDADRAKEAAARWGAKTWYTDYRDMLGKCDELHAVVIATPNNVHRNQAVAAAKAGLQPGDQLGLPSQCPSSTIEYYLPAEEARTVSVTVRRRHRRHEDSAADGEPADQPEPEAASPSEEEAGSPSEEELDLSP